MKHTERIRVKSETPPLIEIDPGAGAAYVRFKRNAKVARTQTVVEPGDVLCAADFDSKGEVVGIELVGVKRFTIERIVEMLPRGARNFNPRLAEFMPTAALC